MADIFEDLRAAGIEAPSSGDGRLALAETLGFSFAHLDRVMNGQNPYTGKLKATIQKLIADNPNPGAVASYEPETVEQGDVDLPAEPGVRGGSLEDFGSLLDQHVSKSTDLEARMIASSWVPGRHTIQEHQGFFKVVKVVAMSHDHEIAIDICDLLNKEGG